MTEARKKIDPLLNQRRRQSCSGIYLRSAESLSAFHSPQNYRRTCRHPSRSGLHLPVAETVRG